MSETVAAVVVTYNRKQLLTECLDALLSQTRAVDKIILIDNASTDGTPEVLEERGYLANPVMDYVRLSENMGGAGGFYEGVKRAHEAGYDWLWLMDDDAEPLSDALEKMSLGFSMDGVLAVANMPVDENGTCQTIHRGWIDLCRKDREVIRNITEGELKKDIVEIGQASFVGLAVNKIGVDKVGYPRKEFFIHHDDFDYCYRISSIGKMVMVTTSVIRHKEARKNELVNASFMGIMSKRIPFDRLWLTYYGTRNLVWLRRRYCSKSDLFVFIFKWYFIKCLGIILYDDRKVIRMKFYFNAVLDGWFGTFDNQKPINITRIVC